MPLQDGLRMKNYMAVSLTLALLTSCGFGKRAGGRAEEGGASHVAMRGGADTKSNDLIRQVVRLVDGAGKTFCSGVLVQANIVLTALHCAPSPDGSGFSVEVPRRDDGRNDRIVYDTYVVAKVISQKGNGSNFEASDNLRNNVRDQRDANRRGVDLAALVLEQPVKMAPDQQDRMLPPAPIMPADEASRLLESSRQSRMAFLMDDEKSQFSIHGYGANDDSGSAIAMGVLKEMVLPFRGYWGLDNEELHVGYRGRLACGGDSGGPLFAWKPGSGGHYLIGISSRFFGYDEMEKCRESDGSIYTNLALPGIQSWINQVKASNAPSF